MSEISLKRENEELRMIIEHSWEMVNMLKAYADSPRAFSDAQKKEILELYKLYKSMLTKYGFVETDLIVPN